MRERNGLLSFFADRRLGTKIGAGFGLVLLILAATSSVAWFAFAGVSRAVANFASLASNSSFYRDIDLTVSQDPRARPRIRGLGQRRRCRRGAEGPGGVASAHRGRR